MYQPVLVVCKNQNVYKYNSVRVGDMELKVNSSSILVIFFNKKNTINKRTRRDSRVKEFWVVKGSGVPDSDLTLLSS